MNNATMKGLKGACLLVFTFLLSFSAVNAQDALLISEYIEGSSNNKALEIYNPNSAAVSLDSYQIAQSSNGDGWEFYYTFPAGSSIPGYGTYVITTDQVSSSLFDTDFADQALGFPSPVHHNGNDARAIIHVAGTDTTFLDVFGDPNSDMEWTVGDTVDASGEHTLVRKPTINEGNTTPLGSFGTDDASSEWIVYPQNDFGGLGAHRDYNAPITIRDLNTYQNVSEFSESAIESHPLTDSLVTVTAVITSYPKNSGLATPDDTDDDGTIDDIGRIHVFVTDTNAIAMGRQGMSIQLVESDYALLEGFTRGDVVTLEVDLGFFGGTAQVAVESATRLGNVNQDFDQYASLLDPWEIELTDLNSFEDGELAMNWPNYSNYNGAYVKLISATVSNVGEGDRVDWAVNKDDSRIYIYDTSLRYRNDRASYLPSYNFRRLQGEDGPFVPPAAGANVDISGFINYVGDDPDALVPSGNGALSINPMEDGVIWNGGTRFVDGEDGFSWPNDLIVNGLPPVVSNVALSDSSVTSSDAVTVTADAEGVDGATITSASLTYSTPDTTITLAMSATTGNEYSATLPTFDNFTPVSFFIEADDSNGLTGRAPLSGGFSFFVSDGLIESISLLQETSDGGAGDSPLLAAGAVQVDITATVISSAGESGFITIQDRAAAWSGVFVETDSNTETLSIGDQINISELIVNETFGVTSVTLNDFTALASSNTQLDTMAVSLLTQDVTPTDGSYEQYEGVFLTFNDVKVTTNQADGVSDFGEWEIGSTQGGGTADTLEAGQGLRVDDNVNFGTLNYGADLNEHVKIGAEIESFTGILHFSFSNPKMVLRTLEDVVSNDWTYPISQFNLLSPTDGSFISLTEDITIDWEPTTDFDGNTVTYEWVLYTDDASSVIYRQSSNNNSLDSEITVPFDTLNVLLSERGLSYQESENFIWNVLVSDGIDTLDVSTGYDLGSNSFSPLFYGITLERGTFLEGEEIALQITGLDAGSNATIRVNQGFSLLFNSSNSINSIANFTDFFSGAITITSRTGESVPVGDLSVSGNELLVENVSFYALDTLSVEVSSQVVSDNSGGFYFIDSDGNGTLTDADVTYTSQEFYTTMVGDFTADFEVGLNDLVSFGNGWRSDNFSFETAPLDFATSSFPYARLIPDNNFNVDDIVAFIRYWNLTQDRNSAAKANSFAALRKSFNGNNTTARTTSRQTNGRNELDGTTDINKPATGPSSASIDQMDEIFADSLSFISYKKAETQAEYVTNPSHVSREVTYDFTLSHPDSVEGLSLIIDYDEDKLTLKNVEDRGLFDIHSENANVFLSHTDTTNGILTLNVANFGTLSSVTERGIVSVTFSALSDEDSEMVISSDIRAKGQPSMQQTAMKAVQVREDLPETFTLSQNYPNPFNPSTSIHYELAEQAKVSLTVYDILGRKIETLLNENSIRAGYYKVNWDASRYASGMYIYVLNVQSNSGKFYTATKKMVMVK